MDCVYVVECVFCCGGGWVWLVVWVCVCWCVVGVGVGVDWLVGGFVVVVCVVGCVIVFVEIGVVLLVWSGVGGFCWV